MIDCYEIKPWEGDGRWGFHVFHNGESVSGVETGEVRTDGLAQIMLSCAEDQVLALANPNGRLSTEFAIALRQSQ